MPASPGVAMAYPGQMQVGYHGDQEEETAADIIQSVKEQEAQFEQLTRELEAERQTVAHQLEKCRYGSETASMSSISSTDESFRWRPPPPQAALFEDISETESKISESNPLVDSCLRVLSERGIDMMGEDPLRPLGSEAGLPPQGHYNEAMYGQSRVTNGPTMYDSSHSPNASIHSGPGGRTVTTTVTKTVTQHLDGRASPRDYSRPQPHSPAGSQDTPSRFNPYQPEADSFDTRHYDEYDYSMSRYSPRDRYDPPPDMIRPGNEPQNYGGPTDRAGYDNPTYASMPTRIDDDPRNDSFQGPDRYGSNPDNYPPMNGSYRDMSGIPQREDSYRDTELKRPEAAPYGDIQQAEQRFNGQMPDDRLRTDSPYSDRYPRNDPYSGDDRLRGEDPRYYDDRPVLDEPVNPHYLDNSIQQRLPPSPRSGYDDRGPPSDRYPPDVFDGQDSLPPADMPHMTGDSPAADNQDSRWRNPELPEVIEFLSHPNNSTKANAAAYLQHLCYMDDHIKAKTRGLGGIPALVELVNNEVPEVHRNACGALRNLSYGRANDENKRAIKNATGIPALVRLLRKTPFNDVKELVTGILWNLSSCQDLKKPIIDEALTVLVNVVVIPHSGWDRNLGARSVPKDVFWTVVFRNASGVLRNISSAGHYGRRKLRECEGLVDSILFIVGAVIRKNDIDNKSVENCVCLLRNLSYACQEVEDPEYLERRMPKNQQVDKESTGCFGGSKKKKDVKSDKQDIGAYKRPTNSEPGTGMLLLWEPDIVHIYLPLLSDCTNSETLEAAAGAVQNLAACEWEPSIQIRAAVRKEKGLPIIVELLNLESDRVVRAAATALRNLALDIRNKDLIGKYAMKQLAQKLPCENKQPDFPISDETISAVEAAIYEIVKKNMEFAHLLLEEGGVERLVYVTRTRARFIPKVGQYASSILYAMWQFKDLQQEYKKYGWREQHFVTKTMSARGAPRPDATLGRPHMDQSGHGTQKTLPPLNRPNHGAPPPNNYPPPPRNTVESIGHDPPYGRMNDIRLQDKEEYDDRDGRPRHPDDIQMNDLAAVPPHAYSPHRDEYPPPPRDDYNPRDDYRPPGGVPMYPPPPVAQPQSDVRDPREPIYSQVNKHNRRGQGGVRIDGAAPQDAADSWV